MQCDVYDTYVYSPDRPLMHFDIIVPVQTSYDDVVAFGRRYLQQAGRADAELKPQFCRFCHVEQAAPTVESAIAADGYYILEMEGCSAEISSTPNQG